MKIMCLFRVLLAGFVCFGCAHAEDNVHFSGALVAEPCTLPDSDTDIKLDFGSVIEKYLYEYQRTESQPFSIHLEQCDPKLLSSVSVSFQGMADGELTNMLALDGTSIARGVAVGLELADGTALGINEASPYNQLSNGSNVLTFNAFVQILPSAQTNKSLVPGDFTAITTFVLAYQ